MQFIEQSWFPLLIALVSYYFAYRLLVLKDTRVIRSKFKPEPKDKDGYCSAAGKLMIFFGTGAIVMAVVERFSAVAGLVVAIVCTLVLFVLWKRMSDKYE